MEVSRFCRVWSDGGGTEAPDVVGPTASSSRLIHKTPGTATQRGSKETVFHLSEEALSHH